MNYDILMNQLAYTKKVLERFGPNETYGTTTPMELGILTGKLINDKELQGKSFRVVAVSLLYLCIITSPDIVFTVNYVKSFHAKLFIGK